MSTITANNLTTLNQVYFIKNKRPKTSANCREYDKPITPRTVETTTRPKSVSERLFESRLSSKAKSRSTLQSACSRISKAESIISASSFEPSIHPKKKSPEPIKPWQKTFDGEDVFMVEQPHYVLMRNSQAYNAYLKEELFSSYQNDKHSVKYNPKSQFPPPVQEYINRLLDQIKDLQLFLEEERLSHKNTKIQAQESLKDQLKSQTTKYESLLKILKEEYIKDKENLKNSLMEQMAEAATKNQTVEKTLSDELHSLSGSFHTYKMNLDLEMKNAIKLKEEELTKKFEAEYQDKIRELMNKISSDREKEKKDMLRQQKSEIEVMRKRFTGESLDSDTRNTVSFSRQKLEDTIKELNEAKEELNLFKRSNEKTAQLLRQTENLLSDKVIEYNNLKSSFDAKISDIEDKYRDRIEDLINDTAQLRLLYVKKCHELFAERQLVTGQLLDKVHVTKDFMRKKLTETRKRICVSIAAHNPNLPIDTTPIDKLRRSSLPSTKNEVLDAELAAGNLDTFLSMTALEEVYIDGNGLQLCLHSI